MGYNSNCYRITCDGDCCNYYGSCPEDFSNRYYDTTYTTCYYYYDTYYQKQQSARSGSIAGAVIGGIFGILIIIGIAWYCKRKRDAQRQLEVQQNIANNSG